MQDSKSSSMATDYHQHDDLINNSSSEKEMSYRDKKKMVSLIDKLDTKDHLGILRIIKDSTDRKIYTVNNYGTYIDLDDIDNKTLWKIHYYVNLCMDNQDREKTKTLAEQEHNEQIKKLETDLRNKSKLKLSMTAKPKPTKEKEGSDDESDDDISSQDDHQTKILHKTDDQDDSPNLFSVGKKSLNIEEYDLDQYDE